MDGTSTNSSWPSITWESFRGEGVSSRSSADLCQEQWEVSGHWARCDRCGVGTVNAWCTVGDWLVDGGWMVKLLEIVGASSDLTLSEPREVDDGREMPLIVIIACLSMHQINTQEEARKFTLIQAMLVLNGRRNYAPKSLQLSNRLWNPLKTGEVWFPLKTFMLNRTVA